MSTAPDPTAAADDGVQPPRPPFIRRVRIRNYKSIAFCDVTLEPLTILVGRNASGKSNFLDALAFVRDVAVDGLRAAITKHGGIDAILCRTQTDRTISFELEGVVIEHLSKDELHTPVSFKLAVQVPDNREPSIIQEEMIGTAKGNEFGYKFSSGVVEVIANGTSRYRDENLGQLTDRILMSRIDNDAPPFFRESIRSLLNYAFDPAAARVPQPRHSSGFLASDGRNLAGVLRVIRETNVFWFDRINDYLRAVAPDLQIAGTLELGGFEILKFAVVTGEKTPPLELTAASMSDGTLRVVAALVAVSQAIPPDGSPSLVAIEEPETALHPAAMRALVSALDEATLRTQVVLTTHSPDLLDAEEVKHGNVRVVRMIDGRTVIAPVDAADIEIVERELNTLAGLERQDRLDPDIDDLERQQKLADETKGAGA